MDDIISRSFVIFVAVNVLTCSVSNEIYVYLSFMLRRLSVTYVVALSHNANIFAVFFYNFFTFLKLQDLIIKIKKKI